LNLLDTGFRRYDEKGTVPIFSQVLTLQRLQSLTFGFGTFAYAQRFNREGSVERQDRASSPHDGLLKDYPDTMLSRLIWVYRIAIDNYRYCRRINQGHKKVVNIVPAGLFAMIFKDHSPIKHWGSSAR
jgi:hypothetical protein